MKTPDVQLFFISNWVYRKWIKDAYEHWDAIRLTSEAPNAGITSVSGYIFSSDYPEIVQNSYIDKIVPIYKTVRGDDLKICPGNWKYGTFFQTLIIESALHLPWAKQRFLAQDGIIKQQKVTNFNELQQFDVLVNCSGFGSKYLCNDKKLVPLRGQVQKVHAPWIKTFFYGDFDTYIIPGFQGVTLGGCRQYDSYNLNVCPYDSAAIRERCNALVPSLKSAKLIRESVGLRPHRAEVRVEKESIYLTDKVLKIVHNYGHGGYGVTTSPGTSKHAVQLVRESLSGSSRL